MTVEINSECNPSVRALSAATDLHGQVALVTGGSKGIGKAITLALAQAGAAVCVVSRGIDALDEVRNELERTGTRACTVAADVSDPDAVRAAIEEASTTLGPVDIVVNNAGVQTSIGDCSDVDVDRWWDDVNVNLRGPMLVMRTVLPSMIERGHGRVVNLASGAAAQPFPHVSAYAAAKAALIRVTETAAIETRDTGVSLFSISPGAVKTQLMDHTSEELARRQQFDSVLGSIEMSFIPPTFAADLVLALAGGTADVLSGRYVSVHDDLPAYIREVSDNPDSLRGLLRIGSV
ncbi:SDR family oxidoreductase [Gordonia sp. zg691]|uniref:SDR family NAD(P)-dependent oxidoreductase n=1 Tax=Gordonia jinghuaiqii TaxID=2758710 RepID=UPI0016626322|nr:SDR family oxidoreductase [Gordonia jinghuaiqii]MBD0859788.1 SDR family oxidoreductase [Gordonia jinghuaiqii]